MPKSRKAPLCRRCGRPMRLLDEGAGRWYCYDDDEVYLAKENRWMNDQPHTSVVQSVPVPQKRSPESLIFWGIVWTVFSIFLGAAGWTLMSIVGFLAGIASVASGIAATGQAPRSNVIESDRHEPSTVTPHPSYSAGLGAYSTPTSPTGSCPYCGAEVFKQNMSCWNCDNALPFDKSVSMKRVPIQSLARVSARSLSRKEQGAEASLDVAYGYYPTRMYSVSFTLTWKR